MTPNTHQFPTSYRHKSPSSRHPGRLETTPTACLWTILLLTLLGLMPIPALASGLLIVDTPGVPPLRIVDHFVRAEIRDRVGYTTIKQTFENTSDQRLEGTYIFPIPEGADITDFQMTFNGKMVKGEVLPAKEAREIYEAIVRQQRDPGLIEFIGNRLMRCRIFPIEPKSKTDIQITYQQICEPMSGMWKYHYPLRTPGTNSSVYGTLRFEVSIESTEPLRGVWSPTHDVEVVRHGDHEAVVAYEKSGGSLDSDFLVMYDSEDSDVGMSLVTYRENEVDPGYFLMLLCPKQLWEDRKHVPQDYVFVVDTSGSMAGEKIDQAREALAYCVNTLEDGDRFSVVRFSTGYDLLFDELRDASAETRRTACDTIKKYNATGGTNIYDALKAAAQLRPADSDRPFLVVFLTDGQGERSREDIEAMFKEETGSYAKHVRLFPFGVGHNVNTKLLDALGTGFGGDPTYVQPGENLEYVLGDFFSIMSEPVLTDLRLSLPDAMITDKFPTDPGDLYHGRQLVLAGRFDKPVTGDVVLKARRGNEDVEYRWEGIDFQSDRSAHYVAGIWAGRKIAYLIDRIRLVGESDELVSEILALSQQFGIQTPYSSWLVNPEGRPMPGRGRRTDDLFLGRPAAAEQLQRLAPMEEMGAPADAASEPGLSSGKGGEAFYFGSGGGRGGRSVQDAVAAESGALAARVSTRNAQMRKADSLDEDGKLNQAALAMRTIDGRDYHNINGILVDSAFTDKSEVIEIKFASDAYFDLVMNREDLRKALSAAKYVIVMVGENRAVFVRDQAGLETLTDKQRSTMWKIEKPDK
ncbi:MAG: VWA domain-containing protein [Planctomycetes bacterium]|nr:VWA domain-containing protein [Planctomycetota bacterium]NOG54670.1 VWA domain-containing protein [Planctomycetota bacterium]